MMRKIEFRAYSVDYEIYHYQSDIGSTDEFSFSISDDGVELLVLSESWSCGSGEWVDSEYWKVDKSAVIEQFTGLHVNGGKLFQGDLIMDHVGIGEVVWCSKNCAFKVSYRNENKGTGKWFCDYLDSEFKSIEIIGNIHEVQNDN